jgi:Holliday junction resolvase RusA-like endonuclease
MITLKELPAPPSTNGLYRNVSGKGRVRTDRYATWANAAGWQINLQKPGKIAGKVELDIYVQRQRSGSDISNRIKAIEDLLVTMGVIDDDKNVERVSICWADVNGCTVTISPAGA